MTIADGVGTIRRHITDPALLEITRAAQALVRPTRLMFNTNDIAVTVFIDQDGSASLRGMSRESTLHLIEDVLPDASNTLKALRSPVKSPETFLVVVQADGGIWAFDWPVKAEGQAATEGVLN